MKTIIQLILSAIAVGITAYLLPGVTVDGFITALIVAVVLAVVNTFVRPIILVLTLPITILTLGLFSLVITALMVILTDYVVPGFEVAGFWSALFFGVVLALISMVFGKGK
jgi:putative membrane protein